VRVPVIMAVGAGYHVISVTAKRHVIERDATAGYTTCA